MYKQSTKKTCIIGDRLYLKKACKSSFYTPVKNMACKNNLKHKFKYWLSGNWPLI